MESEIEFLLWVCFAFICGYFAGGFPPFYREHSVKYDEKKRAEEAKVNYFKRLNYSLKKWIYETYSEGETIRDSEKFDKSRDEKPALTDFYYMFFNWEYIKNNKVKFTINRQTSELLRKHPELLDCMK